MEIVDNKNDLAKRLEHHAKLLIGDLTLRVAQLTAENELLRARNTELEAAAKT